MALLSRSDVTARVSRIRVVSPQHSLCLTIPYSFLTTPPAQSPVVKGDERFENSCALRTYCAHRVKQVCTASSLESMIESSLCRTTVAFPPQKNHTQSSFPLSNRGGFETKPVYAPPTSLLNRRTYTPSTNKVADLNQA